MGGNDMLLKLSDQQTKANLAAMIRLARERGIGVILIGVPRPALSGGIPLVNNTPEFYEELAEENRLYYEGQALESILFSNEFKSDFVHPNARGYAQLAEVLAKLLRLAGAI
jgi:lysophospholipase L1-like esterase